MQESDTAHKGTLHLICGLPASGKTTLAKEIEASAEAVRFSPDEWIKCIWGKEDAEKTGNNYRDEIEQLQWKIAKQFLVSGRDVIIEWGTWGKDERETLRDEAHEIGAKVAFYYLDVPKEELKARIRERNKELGSEEFYMHEDQLDADLQKFQAPDEEELRTYDYIR